MRIKEFICANCSCSHQVLKLVDEVLNHSFMQLLKFLAACPVYFISQWVFIGNYSLEIVFLTIHKHY